MAPGPPDAIKTSGGPLCAQYLLVIGAPSSYTIHYLNTTYLGNNGTQWEAMGHAFTWSFRNSTRLHLLRM